jgi:hypothetical protein
MITVRQIERQWDAKTYDRLFNELLAPRPEGALRLGIDPSRPICTAALAVIRLDELSQSHVKLYSKLMKSIIASQEADGGWGDLVTTALCLRALLCGNGSGAAIDRGVQYLADLQKSEGIWPNIPIRRTPADPYVSALIIYQLADHPRFQRSIRIADAIAWFTANEPRLDDETRQLWKRARIRGRLAAPVLQPSLC